MHASFLLPSDFTLSLMDATFLLEGEALSEFLQLLMQSFGCRYICLWSFRVPSSFFQCLDGYYQDDANIFQAPSSSSGSPAQVLFDEYKQSSFFIHEIGHNNVPGLAFSSRYPCIELGQENLIQLSTNNPQRQFYQEARIKTAVFMGCRSGEVELGFSNNTHVDIEAQMKTLFPEDFSRQFIPLELPHTTTDQQNPPTSSSSSLRSLSIDSPAECSSLLFNIPGHSYNITEPPLRSGVSPIDQATQPLSTTIATAATTTITSIPHHAFANIQGLRFPTPESEHAAMTNAFLAVLSSPSSSTTSPQQHQQPRNFPNIFQENYPRASSSSFRNYSSALMPTTQTKANVRRHNIIKRIIAHCRRLNTIRIREQPLMIGRASSNQLHHMMSERKRREKLNESFQALKAFLPPGTKKDKASILATTREYLSSLKAQVDELRRKNAVLEARVVPKDEATKEASTSTNGGNNLNVHIRPVSESTSQDQSVETRIVDLQVSVRGDVSVLQLAIRILEFLKQVKNVNLMSMEADARVEESNIVNRLTLRLRVEGIEWDESAFQEAVRRVLVDMAPPQ